MSAQSLQEYNGKLVQQGVKLENIKVNDQSTICELVLGKENEVLAYKYHSCQRDNGRDAERPGFGLSLSVLFLSK